ncbi:MAG TPA: hypothetical protein VM144_09835 [Aestuariivirga sp.]|nr:hypothetical protein [Aestuariivirga sp.]
MNQIWKTLITSGLIASGIEYGLCVAVAHLQDYPNYYEQGFYYLLIIWAVQVLIWFKKTIVSTIWYYVWAKRRLSSDIADEFSKLSFPAIDEWDQAGDWLAAITKDESVSHEGQLAAAMLIGQMDMARSQSMIALFRMNATFKLAALKHTRRLPNQAKEFA